MTDINQIKDEIQRQAHTIWLNTGRKGTVAAGTGFGKTRIPCLEILRMAEEGIFEYIDEPQVTVVVPTVKLRDETWPAELLKWGIVYPHTAIELICFASLHKLKGKKRKLIVFDEFHHITRLAAEVFKDTGVNPLLTFAAEGVTEAVMGLTATEANPDTEKDKYYLFSQIAPVVFKYSLDQGVEDGMIADYEIRVIQFDPDDEKKCIPAGTKNKPFLTTELKHINWLEGSIKRYRGLAYQCKKALQTEVNQTSIMKINKQMKAFNAMEFAMTMKRNQAIGEMPSKTALAQRCVKMLQQQQKRTLVFCGSIAQCDKLLAPNVYHSQVKSSAFDAFNRGEISILGVVNAANEGINFTTLDQALIIKIDSNARNLTQRIGRCLRIRDGHKAIIYILIANNTVDVEWMRKSMEGFDKNKVKYYSSKSIPE